MAIRLSQATITVGDSRDFEIARGEDREFRLTFKEPGNSANTGYCNFTGYQTLALHVRGLSGLAFDLGGSFVGSGVVSWLCASANTTGVSPQFAQLDGTYVASDGYRTQVLVRSRLVVLQGG